MVVLYSILGYILAACGPYLVNRCVLLGHTVMKKKKKKRTWVLCLFFKIRLFVFLLLSWVPCIFCIWLPAPPPFFLCSVSSLFCSIDCFLYCCRNFLAWYNPICLFLLLFPAFEVLSKKFLPRLISWGDSQICFLPIISKFWVRITIVNSIVHFKIGRREILNVFTTKKWWMLKMLIALIDHYTVYVY